MQTDQGSRGQMSIVVQLCSFKSIHSIWWILVHKDSTATILQRVNLYWSQHIKTGPATFNSLSSSTVALKLFLDAIWLQWHGCVFSRLSSSNHSESCCIQVLLICWKSHKLNTYCVQVLLVGYFLTTNIIMWPVFYLMNQEIPIQGYTVPWMPDEERGRAGWMPMCKLQDAIVSNLSVCICTKCKIATSIMISNKKKLLNLQ